MTEQEIESGNIIIAKYLGYNPCNKSSILDYIDNEVSISGLEYHESWDRLMPVVLKIIFECSSNCYFWTNGYLVNSNGKYGFAMLDDQTNGTEATHETPILAVWQCVVSYLKSK